MAPNVMYWIYVYINKEVHVSFFREVDSDHVAIVIEILLSKFYVMSFYGCVCTCAK